MSWENHHFCCLKSPFRGVLNWGYPISAPLKDGLMLGQELIATRQEQIEQLKNVRVTRDDRKNDPLNGEFTNNFFGLIGII